MKDSERYIAVDFGSSELRTMIACMMEDNSLHIAAYESKVPSDVRNGIIEQPSGVAFKASQMIKLMCNTARTTYKKSKFSTAVNAKGTKIFEQDFVYSLKKTEIISESTLQGMRNALRKEIEQDDKSVLSIISFGYEVNGDETDNPIGITANRIKGYFRIVVAGGRVNLNLKKCVERMPENELEALPFTSLEALAVAVTEQNHRIEGCAILNFGAETTSLGIFKDDVLLDLSVVPLGGTTITNDISEFGIDLKYSEKLKCLKGVAHEDFVDDPINIKVPSKDPGKPVVLSTKFLAEMIGARLEEMMSPLFEMIKHYQEDIPHGIYLTGGGSQMSKITEFIESRCSLPVNVGDHTGWLSVESLNDFADPEYAQLIGTILLAYDYRQIHHDEKVVEAKKKGTSPITDKLAQGFFKFFEDDQEL